MAKFIQKFQNQSAYDAAEHQYPNTSLVGTDIVFQMEEPVDDSNVRIEVTVNQSQQAKIYSGNVVSTCDYIKVDGTEISLSTLDTNNGYYTFPTGQHTILYKAKNPSTADLGYFVIVPAEDSGTMTVDSFVASEGFRRFTGNDILFFATNIDLPSTINNISYLDEGQGVYVPPFTCTNLTIRNTSEVPYVPEECQDCETMGGYVVDGVCKECNEFDEETGECIDFGEDFPLECNFILPNYTFLYVPASMVTTYEEAGWHDVNAIQ